MSLNIKNEATHDLVRRLAERTGTSQTSAVEDAVRRRLEELDLADDLSVRRARMLNAIAQYRRAATVGPDERTTLTQLYDEAGLPA